MLKTNLIITGSLVLSCFSTAAEATTIHRKLSKNSGEFLLTQLTQSGIQQEAFARDSNTLHLQLYEEARQQQEKQKFLASVRELSRKGEYETLGILLYSRGYPDVALRAFNDAIKTNPGSPGGYFGRAIIRSNRKDFAGALADLDRSIEIEPVDNVGSYYNRGLVKKHMGNRSGAIQDFRRAAQLFRSAGNPKIKNALYQLESLGATE
jgi:tetratricopeptide (TPR) repeat protein